MPGERPWPIAEEQIVSKIDVVQPCPMHRHHPRRVELAGRKKRLSRQKQEALLPIVLDQWHLPTVAEIVCVPLKICLVTIAS